MRLAGRLLLALLLVAVIVWAAVRFFILTPAAAEKVRAAVLRQAAESLTEPLTIDRVTYDLPGRARLKGVRLGAAENPILEVPSAVVHLSLVSLIKNPRDPGLALKGLTLDNPRVRLSRGADGIWNFQRLLKPPKPGVRPARLSLAVRVRGGNVRVEGAGTRDAKAFGTTFKNTGGRALIDNSGAGVRWNLRTRADFAPGLRLSGAYFASNRWTLRVRCARLPLDKFPKFLLPEKLKVGGAVERLDVTLMPGKGGGFPLLEGGLNLKSVSVAAEDFPATVSGVSGGVRFEGRGVRLEGMRAGFGGGEIELGGVALIPDGDIAINGKFAGVSIEAISKNFNEIRSARLRGKLSGSLRLGGRLDAPSALVEVKGEELSYGRSAFDRAAFELTYSNKVLSISNAELRRGKGTVALEGMFVAGGELEDWSGGLSLQVEGVESADFLREIGIGWDRRVGGKVSGMLVAAKSFDGPLMVSGNVRGEPLEIGSYPAPVSLEAAFHGDGGEWTIENLVVSEAGNFIAAAGSVGKGGELSVAIDGCGLDAARAAALAGRDKLPVSGWVECGGGLSGTIDEPAVNFDVKGFDLALGEARGFTLNGGIKRDENGWSSTVELFSRTASVRADAEIAAGGGAGVSVEAKGLPLKQLVGALKDAGVADFSYWKVRGGVVDCDVEASMKEGEWKASGSASGKGLLAYGESAGSASVNFTYDRVLSLDGGRVGVGGEEVRFSGELTGKRMRLEVGADAVELADLKMFSAYQVAGRAGFKARVEGPYGGAALKGDFSPADVELRQVPFKVEGGSFTYEGGVLTVNETVARRGEEKYVARGGYNAASGNLDVDVKFENAAPATFQRFFDVDLREKVSGTVDGSLKVIRIGGELSGTIDVESGGLTFGDFALTRLEAGGGFRDSVIEVKTLYAENEVSKITGAGLIDLSQRRDSLFNLEATSIDLATLARLARLPFSAGGYGDVFIDITGGAGEMRGDIDAYGPSIAGFQFERMRGQFQLTGDAVTLKRFDFLRDGAVLELRAIIPVGDSREGLEVVMNGEGLPLAVLNPFLEGSGLKIEGGFDLRNVTITEGAGGPAFGGTVEVKDGALSYAGLNQPITGIGGLFYLEGDAGALDKFGGEFGGRRVDITGGVFFDGLYPSKIELAFSDVTDAAVEYGGLYKGRVDISGLYISGVPRSMEAGGLDGAPTLRLHHGTVELGELSMKRVVPPAEGGFELAFIDGVKIEVGDEITMRGGGNLKLYPRGELLLGGTLRAPSLKGSLVSTRGFVRPGYSDIVFNIIEPVVIGFYSPGNIGVIPIFYAHGKARVGGIDVFMESSGPMVDLARFPEQQEFCQQYAVTGVGGEAAVSAAPRILVGGDEEKLIPVCPSVYLYAYQDGVPMSVRDIMMHLVRVDEIQSGAPMSQILTPVALGMFTPEISTVVEQGINLENFEINLDPNKDLIVELEKRIAPKIFVRLKRLFFSREIQQEVEFRYKFRKNSYILWNVDQDNAHKYKVEYRFAF